MHKYLLHYEWLPVIKISRYIYMCCCSKIKPKWATTCVKAFMDDLFLESSSLNGFYELLNWANIAFSQARMALKPAKLRCFMLTDDTFQQDITIYVPKSNIDVSIPSISNQPVKFFGKTNSFTISGKDQMEVISLAVSKGLALINKSFHKGVQKVWILQHLLMPRLCWPLLIYEIPTSAVSRSEQNLSCYIWKWLKLLENIEAWYQKKFEKCEPLGTSIKSNGWSVRLFAIKVSAKGSSSTTVKSCLSRLGFLGKLLKSTIKQLSLSSLKVCVQIWLSRDCKRWLVEKVIISPWKQSPM